MQGSLNRINGRLENENSGESVTALVDKHNELQTEIESCKKELDTLYRSFDGFYNDMTSIIRPINYGLDVRVDKLDIYCNMKTMFLSISALKNLISSGQTRLYFDYSSAYYTTSANPSITAEDKLKEENNYRKIEEIWDIIKQYGNWFEEGQEDIEYQFNKYVVAYEERDDDYGAAASILYDARASLWDKTKDVGEDIYNLGEGVVNFGEDLLNLGGGIFQYGMGGTGYLISKITGDTPGIFDYTEDKFHETNKKIKSVFNNPFEAVEDMSQQVSDEYEEKGAAHVVGHYGTPFIANKFKFKSITASAAEGPTIRNRVLNNTNNPLYENQGLYSKEKWEQFFNSKYGKENVIHKPNIKYKEGYYVEHTIGPIKKFTERNGISGGHNYEEFLKYFESDSNKYKLVELNRTSHSDVEGIFDMEFKAKYEKMDYTGKNGTGEYKTIPNGNKTYSKTLYDSSIISSDEIIELSKIAMEEGLINKRTVELGNQTKMKILGEANCKGKILKFEGIKNLITGEIDNAYPVLEWSVE
ncbi:CdiA family toxin C-terminal domain-containing protein [Clostridium sp. SHJSY1]|uniref:hypothetical protein n=1 Tax=Clostridium sp. SHJSY1 TaxID=2942483 RepID=UPI00287515E8|nr:hypothetical protein [Clostridium sp. SHJSY1]MDS0528097.1 CdiA family toxin C-terminal domain-containing protein [Clostridium sp. SHJSY1]